MSNIIDFEAYKTNKAVEKVLENETITGIDFIKMLNEITIKYRKDNGLPELGSKS